MERGSVSITWLLPLMVLAPFGLAHCIEATERGDPGGDMEQTPDSGQQATPDGGQKTPPDDGGQKTTGDSGTKTSGDGGTKQFPDAATPTGDAGGPGNSPDGGTSSGPGSVTCNGAPCDVSHGYFCCVTWTLHGPAESCNPPHSACFGHAIECDDEGDCAGGVCCQEDPSDGMPGSASCTTSCAAHICR
jgi:hypothetical protein